MATLNSKKESAVRWYAASGTPPCRAGRHAAGSATGSLGGSGAAQKKKIGKEEGLRCGSDQSTHVLSGPKLRPSIASPMVVFRASRRTTPAASRKFG